jgi:hypothetical protein
LKAPFRETRGVGRVGLLTACVLLAGLAQAQQPPQNPPPANPTPQSQSSEAHTPQDQRPKNPASQNPTPQNPSQQDEKKNANESPAQQAADRAKQVTLEAAQATEKVGEEALIKARDWEKSWITGEYIPKGQTRVPLTEGERREIYLRQTFTTPGAYMKRMFAAGIDQARGAPPQWDDGWGGYSERFASREGEFIAANSLAALGNAALGYEPRYDQCNCTGFRTRTLHAILRNFVTYNGGERGLRPQWALYGGAFAGGVIATEWKPRPRNALANGGMAVLGQAGYGALLNLFIEFSSEINRKLGGKR